MVSGRCNITSCEAPCRSSPLISGEIPRGEAGSSGSLASMVELRCTVLGRKKFEMRHENLGNIEVPLGGTMTEFEKVKS